jgi:hypothetical protein
MKYTNYVRRENNIYYRRRRRAVGSHTRWGDRNPNALSSYLKGEREMTAECRKNSLLPCGWTIAKSWAALRKCWLGFNITKSQNDRQGMEEFARRIRKIQAELGIEPTNFDSDILDENTVNRIDAIYRKSAPVNEAVKNGEQQIDESNELDCGQIMDWSSGSNKSMPAPRGEIFTTHLSRRDKSCPSPALQPNVNVEVHVTDFENSCYDGPPKLTYQAQIHVKKVKTIYKRQCQAPRTNQDNFAVSAPEDTLAVPDPNQPPIEPIIRKGSCIYPPAKGPPQPIKRDKSCEYDPQVNEMKSSKKEKVIQRRPKSCPYTRQL